MSKNFIVEREVEHNDDPYALQAVFPINDRVTPKDLFRSALYILGGLAFFYTIGLVMHFIGQNEETKLLFTTTKEIIMHFGGLVIGFYFARK